MINIKRIMNEIQEFDKIDRLEMLSKCIDKRLDDGVYSYAAQLERALDRTKLLILKSNIFSTMKKVNKKVGLKSSITILCGGDKDGE